MRVVPYLSGPTSGNGTGYEGGSSIDFFHDSCIIHFKLPNGEFKIIKLPQKDCFYPIVISMTNPHFVIWHDWFGHMNSVTLHRMVNDKLCASSPFYLNPIELCEGCILGKSSHKSHQTSLNKSTQLNQLVHSDLCGPLGMSSHYFLTFVDDFSRYTTVYFLKKKSKVLTYFKEYCNLVIRKHELPIQAFCSDNGGEYGSSVFEAFCKDEGI